MIQFSKAGRVVALAALMLSPGLLLAEGIEEAVAAEVAKRLSTLIPNVKPENVHTTPIEGIYEVVQGTQIYYVSADGRYVLDGELLDLRTRTNLTSHRKESLVQEQSEALLADLGTENMLIYGDSKDYITVFTDISCGYCRKFHREMQSYLDAGIQVRYLMFPRRGVNSAPGKEAQSVWCAADRHKAMDEAKSGNKIPAKTCANPVAQHYQIGRQLGVSGTPTMITSNGKLVPGYMPAKALRAMFDEAKPGGQ